MTKEEIIRDYMAAKTPSKQITILAELNDCKRADIIEILREAGCKLPKSTGHTPKSKSRGVPLATEKVPGAKDIKGKLDLAAVPPELITAVAKVREYGNKKYSDPDNWKKLDPMVFHGAVLRHTLAIWNDPWALDEESGMPNLWHLATEVAFLIAMEDKYAER